MKTQCNQIRFKFSRAANRDVVSNFDGGVITSFGGLPLLREADRHLGLIAQLSRCFTDHRDPDRIEHPLESLLGQRVFALALGEEDLNDHDTLRTDPLLAAMVGSRDPLGQDRIRERDRGKPLAGKSTLNRLELTAPGADAQSRYKKIVAHCRSIDDLFVDLFMQALGDAMPSQPLIIDFDATDDPLHGNQLGRFFHGYYDSYCYLPLYVFCGEHLLAARLRPANIDASAGALKVLRQVVQRLREKWPKVRIIVRGDSGFCRQTIMRWCEENGVDYVLGLSRNQRLERAIGKQMHEVEQEYQKTGRPQRQFVDLCYRTQKSWSRPRRVVAKAEYLQGGSNPRFVVTSIAAVGGDHGGDPERPGMEGKALYEDVYCGRGDMENRIKEQQLCLFADRTSAATMRANQLRLYLSSMAYVLIQAIRRLGLQGTELARAQCSTIREKLLKIGAQVTVTVRNIWVAMSRAFPRQAIFDTVYRRLISLPTAVVQT
ncbi:MAG: IS1380 family transposase [Verrucomicrobia bacterium]|nr:IS1380 family transposase [Verrucomicrobiota bacterium]